MNSGQDSWSRIGADEVLDPKRPLTSEVSGAPQRLLALYEIGRELLEQRDPEQILETIHRSIVQNLKPDHACVLILEEDGSYRPVTTFNLELEKAQEQWPLSRTALDKARQSGFSILTTDAMTDKRFEGSSSIYKFRIRSVMCVPLGRDPVRGLIYADRRGKKRFYREHLEFLTAVSIYASLVLQRAEEYVRTSEALRLSDERLGLLQGELLRHQIVGRSSRLVEAYDTLRRFAKSGARVLLRGETGTGKDLFARAYAANSDRAGKPYVPVPIPALTPTLLESELFGHVKGAFTEASRDKKGRLELADGGVLFLDEVGDIEPALQPKLLRFLDSGEINRVGDTQPHTVDALVVSATNRPLEEMVKDNRFRADLIARLGHVVYVPPLRERQEDIALLVEHFVNMYDRGSKKKIFSDEAIELLQSYRWELNVRQLQQLVERVVCLIDKEVVRIEDLPDDVRLGSVEATASEPARPTGGRVTPEPLKEVIEQVEKEHIIRTLEFAGGNKRKAIEILQLSSDTFYKRLDKFGLLKKGI